MPINLPGIVDEINHYFKKVVLFSEKHLINGHLGLQGIYIYPGSQRLFKKVGPNF